MTKLRLHSPKIESAATDQIRGMSKIPTKNNGSKDSAILSAGSYAQKHNKSMYAYVGNSYGVVVWRVSFNPSDYLNPINNTGTFLYEVKPDLEVIRHSIDRTTPSPSRVARLFRTTS